MSLTDEQQAKVVKHLEAALAAIKVKPEPPVPPAPPSPPEPPEEKGPTFGIDISSHNAGLDLVDAYREGHRFCWVKCTEGPYRDGTTYVNPYYERQVSDAKEAGMAVGAYLFLVETPARAQIDLFLKHAGDLAGMGVAIDFEKYYPDQFSYLTPSNDTLENAVAALRARLGEKPITIYSSESFWDGEQTGTVPSGPWRRYGADVAWIAHWRQTGPEPTPKRYFGNIPDGVNPLKDALGGKSADLGQFCIGRVAGLNIDVNAFAGTLAEYRKLTCGAGDETAPPPPPPPSDEWNPVTGRLAPPGFVRKAPNPGAARYDLKYPTRFELREDVEEFARHLYEKFGKGNIFINTYVRHPATIAIPRPNVSIDIWGGGGNGEPGFRGNPLPAELGAKVFDYVFHYPDPPNIRWIIYHRVIRGVWSGFAPEPFPTPPERPTPFTAHDDHIHITYDGPFKQIN